MAKIVSSVLICGCLLQSACADHPFVEWQTFRLFDTDEPNISYGFGLFPFMQKGNVIGTFELGRNHNTAFLRNVHVTVTDPHWIDLTTGEAVEREEAGPLQEGVPLVDLAFNEIDQIDGNIPEIFDGLLTMHFSVVDPEMDDFEVRYATDLTFTFDADFHDSTQIDVQLSSGSVNVADGPWLSINRARATPFLAGDFDLNQDLEANDIDLLFRQIRSNDYDPVFDLNFDQKLDHSDAQLWVSDLKNTWFGDANLDGKFDSGDLVQVFQHGEYDDSKSENSGWGSGDWNGDLEFDSGDLVTAFQEGGYIGSPIPPRFATSAPEPKLGASVLMAFLLYGFQVLRPKD